VDRVSDHYIAAVGQLALRKRPALGPQRTTEIRKEIITHGLGL